MRLRIFDSPLERLRRARLIAAASAGALLCIGLPLQAQVGGVAEPGANGPGIGSGLAPVVGPAIINAPPSHMVPGRSNERAPAIIDQRNRNIDQTVRGVRAPATTSSVTGNSGELSGTFVADVSQHVRADFSNLTSDLRKAIDGSQGNVREKLISINDRISDISGNLVDRAKETKDQARDRLGEVRTSLNEIHNDLTTLAGSTMDDAKQRIVAVRDRVDTLRTNLESATESRFHGTLGRAVDSVQSRIATAEDRARSVAADVQNRAQNVIGNLQERAENVKEKVNDLASTTMARADTISTETQRRAHDDLDQASRDLSNILVTANEDIRGRLESVDEQFMTIRNDLEVPANETPEAARSRITAARERLTAVHTDLTNILSNATADTKDQIEMLRNRVGEVRNRLNVAGVASVVRDQVDSFSQAIPGIAVDHHPQGKLGITVRQGATALTVMTVAEGTPAAKIGLQPGDQILAINRHRIINHRQLLSELDAAAQGDGRAVVMIRRNGRTEEFATNLAGAAKEAQPTNAPR